MLWRYMLYKNNKGFTLVELIIVISIVLIITSSVAYISTKRSKAIAANNLFKTLKTIVDNYHALSLYVPSDAEFQNILNEFSQIYRINNPYYEGTKGISISQNNTIKKYTLFLKDKNGNIIESRTYDYLPLGFNENVLRNPAELPSIYSVILAYR